MSTKIIDPIAAAEELTENGRPVSARRIRRLCDINRIQGATKLPGGWAIPSPVVVLPEHKRGRKPKTV